MRQTCGLPVAYRYYGVGDQGGAPEQMSVECLERAATGKVR
jgi:hypothetical protein